MAFKFIPNPTFPFTADISDKDGTTSPLKLIGHHKGKKELTEYREAATGKLWTDFLDPLLAGWEEDRPYSLQELETILDQFPRAGEEIMQAYWDAALGAERKN